MRSIKLGSDAGSIKAWYVREQYDADRVCSEILLTIRFDEEQVMGDTETCALPKWEHEWGNKNVRYKPGLDPYKSQVRLLQLGFRESVYVIDLFHVREFSTLRMLMEHPELWIWFYNGKFDYQHILWTMDIVLSHIVDFQAASKVLGHLENNLASDVQHYLGRHVDKEQRITNWGTPELTEDQLTYAAEDVVAMLQLRDPVVSDLKSRNLWTAFGIESKAVAPTAEMELNGTKLDVVRHVDSMRYNVEQLGLVRKGIYEQLGDSIPQMTLDLPGLVTGPNLKSNKQLLALLKSHGLDIEAVNKSELRMKAIDDPITESILTFKKYDKLIDAFGDALLSFIHPVTNRIHATFHGLFTNTLRYSCAKPNLQQIPRCVCKGEHRCCRAWFVPDEGWVIVMADYSVIEMVGAAVVANEAVLIECFRRKLDIARRERQGEAVSEYEKRMADPHYLTAQIVTSKELLAVTGLDRQNAKPVNYGFVYGQQPAGFRVFSLVQYGVRFTLDQATEARGAYFAGYPKLAQWHKHTKSKYKREGRVKTISGHELILEYNPQYDSFAGPAALSYQVQGPCAAGMKRALGNSYDRYRPYMHKAKRWTTGPMICRTVHDEMHLEAPEPLGQCSSRELEIDMKQGMDKIFRRDDLVHVEAHPGKSWADK